MPAGRPTKYKPEFCDQAKKLAEIGAIDAEIARFFEVSESTLNLWKDEYPELSESLKEGKNLADSKVQKSLFQRATAGYEQKAVKIFQYEGQTFEHEYIERFPPSDTACIFWLKNRRKEEWRDKQEHELSGNLDLVTTVNIIEK